MHRAVRGRGGSAWRRVDEGIVGAPGGEDHAGVERVGSAARIAPSAGVDHVDGLESPEELLAPMTSQASRVWSVSVVSRAPSFPQAWSTPTA